MIVALREAAADGFGDCFARAVAPLLVRSGASLRASFVSECSANTFPALPVREGEKVFVAFLGFENAQHHATHQAQVERMPEWRDGVLVELRRRLESGPENLRLAPTRRSRLRG